ncbi:MAG: helix-turn-helix domain-containing protein [Acetatifactor sp.]|nr:helix-turn-helix domain-containing protein [Acetatifactor sp.]
MGVLNDRIRDRRIALGLTLLEIADFLGVKEATAQRYESGAIKTIGHETISRLSEILKCSPSYLMGWEDAPDLTQKESFPLSDLEKEIVRKFRTLNNGERSMFLRSIGIEEEKREDAKMA